MGNMRKIADILTLAVSVKKTTTEIKCQPHIQAHVLAATYGRPLHNQKSLNFCHRTE